MRLTHNGTKRTRHGGSRRRILNATRCAPASWTDQLARQLRREFRGHA